jgi:hypothetical protein
MHFNAASSRALLAVPLLALAALGPLGARAADAPPAGAPSDGALVDLVRGRLRGDVRATARVALEGSEIALLVATRTPGPAGRNTFLLAAFDAGGPAGPRLVGADDMEGIDAPGEPIVELTVPTPRFAPGALVATAGARAADGGLRERTMLYRVGGGRLGRIHALPAIGRAPPGGAGRSVSQEIEVLPTSSVGFRDLRVLTRTAECAGPTDCAEQLDVVSLTFDGARYVQRPHAIPFVEEIAASSVLSEPGALADRSAAAAVDGRPDTAWCEGAKGPGWFEKLELRLSPAQRVKALLVTPGLGTSEAFRERSRPRRLRVVLPDGRKVEATLADEPIAQRIDLPPGDRVFGLTVVIVDVAKGKREDACIAELDLEVEP